MLVYQKEKVNRKVSHAGFALSVVSALSLPAAIAAFALIFSQFWSSTERVQQAPTTAKPAEPGHGSTATAEADISPASP